MFECKLCNRQFNHKSGLSQHIIKTHKLEYLKYLINFTNFKIPKCICGKEVLQAGHLSKNKKRQNAILFLKTCGNKDCLYQIQRDKRLDFMNKNPDKTAWRTNQISYPEQCFLNECYKREYNKKHKIIREYPVFPYYIDFAFINEMVAVEIDGSQHKLRKDSDNKKDELLINNGWKIIRFTANQVQFKIDECFKELNKFIESNLNHKESGIIEYKSKRKQVVEMLNKERKKNNGLTNKQKEYLENYTIRQRKTKRPEYEILLDDIKNLGYVKTGKKYGVSDNAIRKWLKFYEKYK